MTCYDEDSRIVSAYSDRFTVTGMTGVTPSDVVAAVPDDTSGPQDVISASASSAPGSSTSSASSSSPSASRSSETDAPDSPASTSASTPNGGSPLSSGLSTGAKAGIGIAAALFAIIIAAGAWYLLVKRGRRKQRPATEWSKPELHGDSVTHQEGGHQERLASGAVAEAPDTGRPPEMASNVRAELDGNWRGHEISAGRF